MRIEKRKNTERAKTNTSKSSKTWKPDRNIKKVSTSGSGSDESSSRLINLSDAVTVSGQDDKLVLATVAPTESGSTAQVVASMVPAKPLVELAATSHLDLFKSMPSISPVVPSQGMNTITAQHKYASIKLEKKIDIFRNLKIEYCKCRIV